MLIQGEFTLLDSRVNLVVTSIPKCVNAKLLLNNLQYQTHKRANVTAAKALLFYRNIGVRITIVDSVKVSQHTPMLEYYLEYYCEIYTIYSVDSALNTFQ